MRYGAWALLLLVLSGSMPRAAAAPELNSVQLAFKPAPATTYRQVSRTTTREDGAGGSRTQSESTVREIRQRVRARGAGLMLERRLLRAALALDDAPAIELPVDADVDQVALEPTGVAGAAGELLLGVRFPSTPVACGASWWVPLPARREVPFPCTMECRWRRTVIEGTRSLAELECDTNGGTCSSRYRVGYHATARLRFDVAAGMVVCAVSCATSTLVERGQAAPRTQCEVRTRLELVPPTCEAAARR